MKTFTFLLTLLLSSAAYSQTSSNIGGPVFEVSEEKAQNIQDFWANLFTSQGESQASAKSRMATGSSRHLVIDMKWPVKSKGFGRESKQKVPAKKLSMNQQIEAN